MQGRDNKNDIRSDLCMWYPPFLEAVLNKHQETVDTAFIHYRTLFQFEKLAAEPVALLMSLELLDRLLAFKNKDQVSREKFPVSTELLIIIVFYYTAKYCIDGLKLFTNAPLIRSGMIALQAQKGIPLSLNADNLFEFFKNLMTKQAIDAHSISLLLAHLFRLEVLMEPIDEIAAMQRLTASVLMLFGRDECLFETLAQELRDEKSLNLMHSDAIIANIFVGTMLENGCFNSTDRQFVAAIFPELNAALFPLFKQVSEQAYTDISKLSAIDGLRSALEHKSLEERYSAYNLMIDDLNELESHLIEVYYATPALFGSLEKIFKVLFHKGVLDLFELTDEEAIKKYVFDRIYDFIEGNGNISVHDTLREIMHATRRYFSDHAPAFSRMIGSPLIPNFPYYRDILIHSLSQAYGDMLEVADIDDEESIDEMCVILDEWTNAQLHLFSQVMKIIYQYNRGLEYQLIEWATKNVEVLAIFHVLIQALDRYQLLRYMTVSDFRAIRADSSLDQLADDILFDLLETGHCMLDDRGIVKFATAFGLNLNKMKQALDVVQSRQLHYPRIASLTTFSFTIQPITSSSSEEELKLSK